MNNATHSYYLTKIDPTPTEIRAEQVQSLVRDVFHLDDDVDLTRIDSYAAIDRSANEVVAVVNYHTLLHKLVDVCVDEKHRRRGLARRLLEFAIGDVKKNRPEQYSVTIDVDEGNVGAFDLYRGLGFKPLLKCNWKHTMYVVLNGGE